MKLTLKPWQNLEKLYFYPQSTQIAAETGLIGKLRATFGQDGSEFITSWDDIRSYLKTEEFKNEIACIVQDLRFEDSERPLESLDSLRKFLRNNESALLPDDGEWHGLRLDTKDYSFFFRLKAEASDYNMYCYCYKKNWLDYHIRESAQGIRFLTSDYKRDEKFRIPDGGKVRITYDDGETKDYTARFIDDYHVELESGHGWNLYHICELVERLDKIGAKIEPAGETITRSLEPTGQTLS